MNRTDPTGEFFTFIGEGTCWSGGKDPVPYPCDQYAFAGFFQPTGPVNAVDLPGTPTLGGTATNKQQKQFQASEKLAESKLKNKDCAGLFNGSATDDIAALESATYTYAVSFYPNTATPDPDIFATTETTNGVPTGNVTINMVGSFFDIGATPIGQLLGANAARAFVLLHELGHLTEALGDDTTVAGKEAAATFNTLILTDCFGIKQ